MVINLLELFNKTVKDYPNKAAVIDGDKEVSFSELSRNVNIIASHIHEQVKGKNLPVAVFLPKSAEAVASDLGISKSANVFMNLDVKTPAQRIGNILDLIKPSAVISDSKNIKLINDVIGSIPVILLDELDWNKPVDDEMLTHLADSQIDTDPFCIINTSGSTGTPKGVALCHLNFLDFLYRSLEAFSFTDNEIIGSLSPIVFDIYVFELCLMMANAATMVLLPANLSAFPAKILQIMQARKVSFIFWVPTIMVNIANMGLLYTMKLPYLKLIWFAGEVFPTKQFNIWKHSLPQSTFANLYGPIETALDSIFYIVDREIPDDEPLPIGYAYRNTDILLLDENDNLVTAEGVEGEICVRGSSVALGYYNNLEKTALAFVQNPLNRHYPERIYRTGDIAAINKRGEIVFRGRKDSLIKHLGYRIELGEIEHVVVNTLHLVKNGCVVYNHKEKAITLFYENPEELAASDFRRSLSKDLPKYMIPTVMHQVEELRRNTNGKIDRLYYKNLVNG